MIAILVTIILALGFTIGYTRGIIKIACALTITVVSLILVTILTPIITTLIMNHTQLDERLGEQIISTLISDSGQDYQDLTIQIPLLEQIKLIETSDLPKIIQEALLSHNNSESYSQLGVQYFQEYVGRYIAKWIIQAVVFVITFIVVFIAMQIFVTVINLLAKLPIIHGTNKIMGGLLGIMISLVVIWMMFITIDVMYQHQWARDSIKEIQDSQILSIIYQNNLILSALGI